MCDICGKKESVAFLNKMELCKMCWCIMKHKESSPFILINRLKENEVWDEFIGRFPKVVGVNDRVNRDEIDRAMRKF